MVAQTLMPVPGLGCCRWIPWIFLLGVEAQPFCVSLESLAGYRGSSCSCGFEAEVVLVPEAAFSRRLLRSSLVSSCGCGGGGSSGEPVGPPGVGCDPADCLISSGPAALVAFQPLRR